MDHKNTTIQDRDVVAEGNTIKQKLTQKVDSAEIQITSITDCITDGMSIVKPFDLTYVGYVPDFYYYMDACDHMFTVIRVTSKIKRMDQVDYYGFVLYLTYCGFYHYLRTLSNTRNYNIEFDRVIAQFERCGFKDARVPSFLNQWYAACGVFKSSTFGRQFEPEFIQGPLIQLLAQGVYNVNTAHLLPNFIGFIRKATFLTPNPDDPIIPANRTIANYLNLALPNPPNTIANMLLIRANDEVIPGMKHCVNKFISPDLRRIFNIITSTTYQNPLDRYLQLNIQLLSFLVDTYNPVMALMDTFKVSEVSLVGTELIECPIFDEGLNVSMDTEHRVLPGQSLAGRIKTKRMITDGYAMKASVLPIVRISSDSTRVNTNVLQPIPVPPATPDPLQMYQGEVEEPQSQWFYQGVEYISPIFNIFETHSRIAKK